MKEFFIVFFLTLNIGSFIYFGLDKRKANNNRYRISEKKLLIMTFFGGSIGSILGILIFNHKTSKESFIFKIVLIVLIQLLIMYLVYNYYKWDLKTARMKE